jgi:type II secretory pathway pseudopilin PulG
MRRPGTQAGFTLIEALVALGIVATVVIQFIGMRTTALIDATYARNWRLSRELAEMKMSELQAGAREVPPRNGDTGEFEDYKGFSWKIVIGEANVADAEAELDNSVAGENTTSGERLTWQRERDDFRKAKSRGQSASEFQEQQRSEDINLRLAEKAPSATEFEQVAVILYFPKLDPDYPDQKDALVIKAKLSTLAISGMTPEQAAQMAEAMGSSENGKNGGSAGRGNAAGGASAPGSVGNAGESGSGGK